MDGKEDFWGKPPAASFGQKKEQIWGQPQIEEEVPAAAAVFEEEQEYDEGMAQFENLTQCNQCPQQYYKGTVHSCFAMLWEKLNSIEKDVESNVGRQEQPKVVEKEANNSAKSDEAVQRLEVTVDKLTEIVKQQAEKIKELSTEVGELKKKQREASSLIDQSRVN